MVELQVGKQTPYSRDEILWGYRVLGTAAGGYTRVMLAIAQRAVVRQRVNIVEEAGLEIEAVSVSTEGLLNWLSDSGVAPKAGGAVLVADVDSACTDVCVSTSEGLVFSRSLRIGAGQLRDEGETWVERFASEIRQTLDACRGEHPGLDVDRLVVTGAGAAVEEMSIALKDALGIPCDRVDAAIIADRMPRTPSMKDPLYSRISLTAAMGMVRHMGDLAFNLMPDSVMFRRRLIEKSRATTALGVLLMSAMVALSLLASVKLVYKQTRLNRLRFELREAEALAKGVIRKQEVIKLVRKTQDKRRSPVNIFAEIQRARPGNVYCEKLEVDTERGRLTISGSAGTLADARALFNNLENSDLFSDVKPGSTTLERDGRYAFQVACAVEDDG
jgi:Tfp pilus assembly protein PilN